MAFSGKEDVSGSFGNNKFNLPDKVKKHVPESSPSQIRKERKEPLIEERQTGVTHYSEFKHPNMMTEVSEGIRLSQGGCIPQTQGFYVDPDEEDKGCGYYFKMFDDKILRPIMIYKYNLIKFVEEVDFE